MAATPNVGERIINDAGTCVTIVNDVEGETPEPGTIFASDVPRFIKAGYRVVTPKDVIPVQQHHIDAERAQ